MKITHKNSYESSKLKKYKKNINKLDNNKIIYDDNLEYAIVIETTYNHVYVLYKDHIIKTEIIKTFNCPCNKTVYVGDKVVLNNKTMKIEKIVSRKNVLSREKIDSTKINGFGITKVVAVNIDLAVIVVSSTEPPLHPKFIDRYTILLKSNNIPFVIVMNKCELKTEHEDKVLELYKELGMNVIETSTVLGIGIDKLKEVLKNKQAILVGHSGVGKSSLVNELMKEDNIKVGSVGEKSKRGCHTTTSTKYYKWDESSSIIDTPGIRSLDISNYNVNDIQNYFEEIKKLKGKCKYNDCLHYEESVDSCYIKQAVNLGLVNSARYESYIRIIENILKK